MECDGQNILSFWTVFCPFTLHNDSENHNFQKIKKMPGNIIILHMCTINDNHMINGSSDMECNRQNFLSFWTIFCPFTPLKTQKIKISSFYTSVPKIMIICYTVLEISWVTDIIFIFHFGLVFALLCP